MDELVAKNVREGRLHFSTSLADSLEGVLLVFSAVGTPPDEDGSADLRYVLDEGLKKTIAYFDELLFR